MVIDGIIVPIEKLPPEIYKEYWQDTLEHAQKLDEKGKIAFMKAYYALSHLIEIHDNNI